MPLGPGVKYRYKKGTDVRLAFQGGKVVEAKNTKTGATHTPEEFKADEKAAAAEKPAAGGDQLTALGRRTLAGFEQRWGPKEGRDRFEKAMDNGTIDRTKMERG